VRREDIEGFLAANGAPKAEADYVLYLSGGEDADPAVIWEAARWVVETHGGPRDPLPVKPNPQPMFVFDRIHFERMLAATASIRGIPQPKAEPQPIASERRQAEAEPLKRIGHFRRSCYASSSPKPKSFHDPKPSD